MYMTAGKLDPKPMNPLRRAFWADSWILGVTLVFSFIVAVLHLTVPMFILLIYDRVLPSRSLETLFALMGASIVLLIALGGLDFCRRRLLARFGARLQERVEGDAIALSRSSMAGISGAPLKCLDSIRGFFHSFPAVALIDVIWVPLFLGTVFVLHPWFGWTAIAGIILLIGVFTIGEMLSSWRREQASEASERSKALTRRIRDGGGNGGALRGLSSSLHTRWRTARRDSRTAAVMAMDRIAGAKSLLRILRMIFTILILAVGGVLVLQAKITTGALIAAVVLLNRVFTPILNIFANFRSIRAARKNWLELDGYFVEARNAPHPLHATLSNQLPLEIDGVSLVSDHSKQIVLRNVALSINPGEIVEITGPSGSGKSLMAEALQGLRSVRTGTLRLGGVDMTLAGPDVLRNTFGYLPETVAFVDGTIVENITSFETLAGLDGVIAAARSARAHEMIQNLPSGYQTVVNSAGSRLSRGQRQLIGLTRALYNDPRILVLDEPDDIVDEAFGDEMGRAITDFLGRGNAILIFGRRTRNLPKAVRRFRIVSGRVEAARVRRPGSNVTDMRAANKKPKTAERRK